MKVVVKYTVPYRIIATFTFNRLKRMTHGVKKVFSIQFRQQAWEIEMVIRKYCGFCVSLTICVLIWLHSLVKVVYNVVYMSKSEAYRFGLKYSILKPGRIHDAVNLHESPWTTSQPQNSSKASLDLPSSSTVGVSGAFTFIHSPNMLMVCVSVSSDSNTWYQLWFSWHGEVQPLHVGSWDVLRNGFFFFLFFPNAFKQRVMKVQFNSWFWDSTSRYI